MSPLGCGQLNCDITSNITHYGNQKFDCCYSSMYFNIKKSSCLLIISSLFFGIASRSLSCNGLNDGTNGCQELDSICVVKKIGTFFGISSKIRLSWIKDGSVAMGLFKSFVTYFNAQVSLLGPTWHFDYKKLILENQI